MTDHRPSDGLNESAIDREIKAALAVEPSPEFLPRVRVRVANEPEREGWRLPWLITVAGAVAATVVIVFVVSHSSQRATQITVDRAPVTTTSAVNTPAVPSVARIEQPAVIAPDARTKRSVNVERPANVASEAVRPEPEILIDRAEARALRRLLVGIRDRRIDSATLPPEVPQVMTTIEPLGEIAPLPPIEPLGPARQ